ncbi:MAG: HypC/HybG/HupF family hydrogenase formation chaperone [Actinomycetota bacterium]|nr:HypC/HybG/HupF family hydrogenase formation chaperone [Actinomycetota bacterium]
MAQEDESPEALGSLAGDIASAALALARSFASGATMWCWAPEASEHAQHVAVEFVHPVIMGKRALPAVALTASGSDAVGLLRCLVRPGDVILVVGADLADNDVQAVLRRVPSWGATTIWIGSGDRPPPGAADHVLWSGGDPAAAAHDGRFVLIYHLLWELTHVCFEHPGLVQPEVVSDAPVCITCSDEGNLAEVVHATSVTATVRTPAGVEEIDTTLVGDVSPGDLVLVHAGTALTIVDEASGAHR